MLQNYLITALRNFTRHKLYSIINIAGLAVALACTIFILLFIRDELSYDRWIPGSANIYRVDSSFYYPGHGIDDYPDVPFPVSPAMQADIPEVEAQTHLIPEQMSVNVDDRMFLEILDVVDPNFFNVIKLPFVEGDPATALSQPESIVLSQAAALKFFGNKDPIGRTLTLYGAHTVTVTGVLRDLPHNTDLIVDLVLPNTSKADGLSPAAKGSWLNVVGQSFVRLAPHADPGTVLGKAKPILDKNIDAKKELGLNLPGSKAVQLHLTRLSDMHLGPLGGAPLNKTAPGSWAAVYGFGIIAAFIILIACFNLMNLATARAMMRAREVSLRKVMGAGRGQLIAQFLGESVLTALIALVLALAAVEVLLPIYDAFVGRPIVFHYVSDWPLALGIIAVAVTAGLLSGLYPAFVLSGFRPAATLGTTAYGHNGPGILRTTLVVLQFAISIGLGIATLVVFAQINYARQTDLGFDRDNMVVFPAYGVMTDSVSDSLVQTLKTNPAIVGATRSGTIPFGGTVPEAIVRLSSSPQTFSVATNPISPDSPPVYDTKLLAGRELSLARGTDSHAAKIGGRFLDGRNVLINASAARRFGFGIAGAVGRKIEIIGNKITHVAIVGVLDDAKVDGLQTPVQPTIYYYNPADLNWFSVRIRAGHEAEAFRFIDRTWRRLVPTRPIARHSLNDSFDRMFAADEKQGVIFGFFVAVAIFIACLGLFGLAALVAERRTKEIGIRKTFGAGTRDIVWLLLWQFSIPVLVANVIAWPIAYYYLHTWLERYAYRISLDPLYFAAAGLAALAIAWVTVAGHALRVARAHPVHALRYE